MKLLSAAVGKITQYINTKSNQHDDFSKLTEGYLRRYPVRSFGIPVADVEDIMLTYQLETKKLIPAAAIRINSDNPEEPTFSNLYKKTITNLAEYVHLLPASEYHHHHELGGLFYHSLQTAHGCLEKARSREGKIPRDKRSTNIDVFQVVKPKWIYGAWALGLIHDIGKVIMDINVYEHGKESNIWNPLNESLVTWAMRSGVKSYETRFSKDRQHGAHEEMGALLVKDIISEEGIEYLRGGGPLLLNQIYQYMSGKYIDGAFLHQIVKHVDGLETARDINMRWDKHLGESKVNVEKIFISSARTLLPTFKVNEEKGKIFVCGGRAFVTIAAIDKIIAFAKQENYKHFPSSTKEFCESLMEAGVVEPIRDRNGEATDEWFGILQPGFGNEYRVIKLISPIVIYWDGETPRSIEGEYIVGNTGVKEIYKIDGSVTFDTGDNEQGETNVDSVSDTGAALVENIPEDSSITRMSEGEMDSHIAAMEMYESGEVESLGIITNDADIPQVQCLDEVEIPRPKPKKPNVTKSGNPEVVIPPKLETHEPNINENNNSSGSDGVNPKEAKETSIERTSQDSNQTQKTNKRSKKAQSSMKRNAKGVDRADFEISTPVKQKNKISQNTQTEVKPSKNNNTNTNKSNESKYQHKKLNQFEEKFGRYLSEGLGQKMEQGDVVYIDKTFALSISAISEITNRDYMSSLPELKAKKIISDERGIRKVEFKGNERVLIVLNLSLFERIVHEKSIDIESIAIVEREEPTVKDRNNRRSDLIAQSEVAENKDDYASQVKAMLQTVNEVIEREDGIYVEISKVTKIKRRIASENQMMLHAAIELGHYMDIEDKTYIRILEN